MAAIFQTTRRVEFRDTDAAGIMHFSVFFTYMEQVEHQLLRDLGLSVVMHDELGSISWPRVSATCDYHQFVRFEDVLDIEACIARVGEKSVTYNFDFHCRGQQVASGTMVSVCCRMQPGGPPTSIAIPQRIADKLSGATCPQP